MRNKFEHFLKISCLLLLGSFFSVASAATEMNTPAADFTLKSLSGKNLKLSEYAGNVVLLNFWASWCAPCRLEMPLLNDLHNKYEKLGFVILGVNVEEQTDEARAYITDRPVDFPILFDDQNSVSKQYNVIAMPTTVMIDRNGNMRYLHQGYIPGDEKKYKKMIKKLIRE
ncbi:MAG: TlpA family protein disulfide reductase [Gammaproteobacteria bacterium]|jgi:peroxiredoxin|nr:TlpA family protein disulfide reductase [Gammaproteobacteria bacterium]MBT4862552.1 TlpA family protein disulfide reductase [Gammaproteobacteria bacterium]MBT7044664.1 TlpA family protein disulfide reductase [Gammaproteobacteria bacterium]